MKARCLNNKSANNLIENKIYEILDTRKWDNGYVQYLIKLDKYESWFSSKRFSNRKDKLKKLNEICIKNKNLH